MDDQSSKNEGDCAPTFNLGRIPVWYEAKLLFVAWLVLPQFRGASFIYDRFVREQLRKRGVRLQDHHGHGYGHGHGAEHEPHPHILKVCIARAAKPLCRLLLAFSLSRSGACLTNAQGEHGHGVH